MYLVGELDPDARESLEKAIRDVCALLSQEQVDECVRALQNAALDGAGGAGGLALAVVFLAGGLALAAVGLVPEMAEPVVALALVSSSLVVITACGALPFDAVECAQSWAGEVLSLVFQLLALAHELLGQAEQAFIGIVCPGQLFLADVHCVKQAMDQAIPSCLDAAGNPTVRCWEDLSLACGTFKQCVDAWLEDVRRLIPECVGEVSCPS